MMRCLQSVVLMVATVLFAACRGASATDDVAQGDTLRLKYAEHINIIKYGRYDVVELANPWRKGEVLHRYVLVDKRMSTVPRDLPEGTVVYTPVESAVVFNSPHCRLLSWLDAVDAVKGVCDSRYIRETTVRERLGSNRIVDCGSSMSPLIERIVETNPQIVMLSPFENAGYGQLEKTGIPLIECAEYMETSALGRAEWMKFYGMLFGREQQADSLFGVVDSCYNSLARRAKRSKMRPSILTERKTGSVWYCPGGRSSMGMMFKDANIAYAFADDESSGSLSLAPEYVLEKGGSADKWLVMSSSTTLTRDMLLDEYRGYKELNALKHGEVYVCYTNDKLYFDEISFRPDFLLTDLLKIFHPDVVSPDSLRYYVRLAQ